MTASDDDITDLASHQTHAGALSAEYSRLGHLQSGHSVTLALALALAKQSDYRLLRASSELTPLQTRKGREPTYCLSLPKW